MTRYNPSWGNIVYISKSTNVRNMKILAFLIGSFFSGFAILMILQITLVIRLGNVNNDSVPLISVLVPFFFFIGIYLFLAASSTSQIIIFESGIYMNASVFDNIRDRNRFVPFNTITAVYNGSFVLKNLFLIDTSDWKAKTSSSDFLGIKFRYIMIEKTDVDDIEKFISLIQLYTGKKILNENPKKGNIKQLE
jgi:hypothetical protein